ncbi:MAG: glycosyltransferase, partial [Opitutus sp.]|nr:glycosyltransferase [Opitutus sp.]
MPSTFALVTPSLDQAAFLSACMDSVLRQQGCTVHHAVRDGGSTDGSVEILRGYGERVRWRSGPDGGQARAINAALQSLPGEICGYLNSDDVLLPGARDQRLSPSSAVRATWVRAGRHLRDLGEVFLHYIFD